MICGGITMEEMSIQSMCACAASVRETSTSETTPSSIKISTTPGSPFRSDLALSICGRVMSPPSSRTLSTYSSLCCTWEECWSAQFTAKPLNFQRERIFGHRDCPNKMEIIPRSHSWRDCAAYRRPGPAELRSEEHTSELQSQSNLVCRLLLEKKKKK